MGCVQSKKNQIIAEPDNKPDLYNIVEEQQPPPDVPLVQAKQQTPDVPLVQPKPQKPADYIKQLFTASQNGDLKALKQAIENGADVNYRLPPQVFLSEPNTGSWTPLMFAAKYGHIDCLKELLRNGADPNLQVSELVYMLLNVRPDSLAEGLAKHRPKNLKRSEALYTAIIHDNLEIAIELLKFGASYNGDNPRCAYSKARSPLELAIKLKRTKITELLTKIHILFKKIRTINFIEFNKIYEELGFADKIQNLKGETLATLAEKYKREGILRLIQPNEVASPIIEEELDAKDKKSDIKPEGILSAYMSHAKVKSPNSMINVALANINSASSAPKSKPR